MADDLFESAKSLVRWAGEEIEEFDLIATAFGQGCEAETFAYPDLTTGRMVHGYEVRSKPPEKLRKLGYRIVNDLRNALDQSVHAASLALETKKPTKTNFPVADTPDGVERRLKTSSICRGIPTELHDKILSFNAFWPSKDYRGGNVPLRALLEVANPNKHRVAISAGLSQNGLAIRRLSPNVSVHAKYLGDNKFELFRVPIGEQFDVNMGIEFCVMFQHAKGLGGLPATLALNMMTRATWEVVSDLEIEAMRLASLRG